MWWLFPGGSPLQSNSQLSRGLFLRHRARTWLPRALFRGLPEGPAVYMTPNRKLLLLVAPPLAAIGAVVGLWPVTAEGHRKTELLRRCC
jgi:hypothetical protein